MEPCANRVEAVTQLRELIRPGDRYNQQRTKRAKHYSLPTISSTILALAGCMVRNLLRISGTEPHQPGDLGDIVAAIVIFSTKRPFAEAGRALITASSTAEPFSCKNCSENENLPTGTAMLPFLSNLNSTRPAFTSRHSFRGIVGNGASFRIRHQTTWSENFPQLTNFSHTSWRSDCHVEVPGNHPRTFQPCPCSRQIQLQLHGQLQQRRLLRNTRTRTCFPEP